MILFILFVCFDSFHSSQQFFSHVGIGLLCYLISATSLQLLSNLSLTFNSLPNMRNKNRNSLPNVRIKNRNNQGRSPNVIKVIFHTIRIYS